MVGAGHPTLADTLNRALLIQHNDNGVHTDIAGDGTKSITGFNIPLYLTQYLSVYDAIVPYYDVRFSGATGDGTTDDTAAVQTVMTLAAGKGLFIPPNYTFIVKGINVSANTRIFGGGTLKLKALIDYDGSPILNILGDNVVIDGIILDGNKANQSASGYADAYDTGPNSTGRAYRAAIKADGYGDGLIVRNCLIKDAYGAGVATRDVQKVSVLVNRFESNKFEAAFIYGLLDNTYSGGSGHQVIGNKIYNTGSGHVSVNGNAIAVSHSIGALVSNNYVDNTERDCVKLETSKYVDIIGNVCVGNNLLYSAIQLQGTDADGSVGTSIIGNVVTGFSIGILIGGTVDGLNVINNIIDNVTHPTTADAIVQDGSLKNAVIKGNVIRNAGRFGIHFQSLNGAVVIDSNMVVDSGAGIAIGTVSGLDNAYVTIKNNYFKDAGGTAADFGVIWVNYTLSGVMKFLEITGNTILAEDGSAGRGIYAPTVGFFENAVISNNYIDGQIEVYDNTVVAYNNYVTGQVTTGTWTIQHQWYGKQKMGYAAAAPTSACTVGDIVFNTAADNVLGWKCTNAAGTWKYMQTTLEP
jgi:hypothetical protein